MKPKDEVVEKDDSEVEQKPFKLAGSIQSDLTAEELGEMIDQMRREQAELVRKKFADLYDDD